jgi:abhydrolase domain-containing protein 6
MKKLFILILSLILVGCASGQKPQETESVGLIEKTTKIESFEICYHEGGKGETVLLLHGFGGVKEMWFEFAQFLIPSYHVIILDLPGHGKSTKSIEASYTIEKQAERIDQFANSLELSKFHIAGNSMGGTISGEYAVNYPDRLLSLGLFDTGGVLSNEMSEFISILLLEGKNILIAKNREEYDKVLEFVFFKIPSWPQERMDGAFERSIADPELKEKIFEDITSGYQIPLQFNLNKINAPTLILWGDKDRILDVSCAKILEKGISNSKTVIMKDMGHCPQMERPEETANHYIEFLQSI